MLFGWFGTLDLLIILFTLVLFVGLIAGLVAAVYFSIKSSTNCIANSKSPSLIPCPDCNSRISIHARTCPRCGRPMEIAVGAVDGPKRPERPPIS
jgi:hypothetical protein